MTRVLGIDLGIKRTGLALSDELGITARALPNLNPRSRVEDVQFLVEMVRSEHICDVVIGLPSLPRSGDDGPMAKRCRGFADALQGALDAASARTRVHLVDETLSSRAAAARLCESGVARGKRKDMLDSEVARGLVLDWIARRSPLAG